MSAEVRSSSLRLCPGPCAPTAHKGAKRKIVCPGRERSSLPRKAQRSQEFICQCLLGQNSIFTNYTEAKTVIQEYHCLLLFTHNLGRPHTDTIQRKVQTIEAAIREAEKLKLLAITDGEVERELQKLTEILPGEAKAEALIISDDRDLRLDFSELSELARQSQPIRDIKRGIRESLGIPSFRPRRR